ncbi:MAG: aromatic ring-hydroxylating dioxygenase subunit alpha [Pseudomonadota bacterium]
MTDAHQTNGATPMTLPGRYYYDPAVYEAEKEQIFYRTWQYVGHVSLLSQPSQYLVRDIGDQSVFVLRDTAGELRAFFNVCQHRAHRLLEGEGSLSKLITCPYHAWCYQQDGSLCVARGTEHIPSFDRNSVRLKAVRLESLCGFLFVNLDDKAPSLAEQTPGLEAEMRAFAPEAEQLQTSNRYFIPLKANWKNSIENFAECYHCPGQHPTLTQNALDLGTYKIECLDNYHVHRSRDKGDDMGYHIERDALPQPDEFRSFYIWPNTVIEVYPGHNLTVFHHVPVGPEETHHAMEWYFPSAEPTAEQQAVVDFVHQVRIEDVPICESVQKGLHSKGYQRGHLILDPDQSDVSEHAVFHFQQKIAQALSLPS